MSRQVNASSARSPFHPEIWRRTSASAASSTGAYPIPSCPITWVVTPWLSFAHCAESSSSARSLCACMSTNPGASVEPSGG